MYTLKAPLEVDNAQAEKYAVYSLEYDRGKGPGTESIDRVRRARGFALLGRPCRGRRACGVRQRLIDKFRFADGQTVNLYDKYEDETREVTYEGDGCAWGTKSDMAVYMSLDDFNRFFGTTPGTSTDTPPIRRLTWTRATLPAT